MSIAKFLLICGILASLLHFGMNIIIPMYFEGYSSAAYTVSELSAIGAPTRPMWVKWAVVYTILLLLFGIGVLKSAGGKRTLRFAGILLIANAVIGAFWPPMHPREVIAAGGGTISDTLHIVWTAICVPLMMLSIGFGAAAFGKAFRWYSAISIVLMLVTGAITGIQSPDMEANLPTPWIGVWERIGLFAYMIWLIVFACLLLKGKRSEARIGLDAHR